MKTFSVSVTCETIGDLISGLEAAVAHAFNGSHYYDEMEVDTSIELEDEMSSCKLSISRIE